jgi:hypothetical protein
MRGRYLYCTKIFAPLPFFMHKNTWTPSFSTSPPLPRNWGEPERAPQFGGSSRSSAMHYGAFVVRTYTELFLQWFKSYRLFASHRLFWELSVFIQWFTVNFTGLSPLTGWQFFMRWNIFFMPNNKWKLEWSVLFTVVSIINLTRNFTFITRFLSELWFKFWYKARFRFDLGWIYSVILLFFSKTMKKDIICKFLQSSSVQYVQMFSLHGGRLLSILLPLRFQLRN